MRLPKALLRSRCYHSSIFLLYCAKTLLKEVSLIWHDLLCDKLMLASVHCSIIYQCSQTSCWVICLKILSNSDISSFLGPPFPIFWRWEWHPLSFSLLDLTSFFRSTQSILRVVYQSTLWVSSVSWPLWVSKGVQKAPLKSRNGFEQTYFYSAQNDEFFLYGFLFDQNMEIQVSEQRLLNNTVHKIVNSWE